MPTSTQPATICPGQASCPGMDEGLIRLHALATSAACAQMTGVRLKALYDSVEHAAGLRGRSAWSQRAAAHAEIFTLLALTEQSAENREFIRRLLRQKQPAFFAALELAADLVDQELGGASSTSPADQDSGAPAQTANLGTAWREGWDWRMRAACRHSDPELFFPVGTAGPALVQLGQAKRICATCPVRLPCLDWALASGQEVGVWGGMSEDERRILWRLRRGTARPGRTALG